MKFYFSSRFNNSKIKKNGDMCPKRYSHTVTKLPQGPLWYLLFLSVYYSLYSLSCTWVTGKHNVSESPQSPISAYNAKKLKCPKILNNCINLW